VTGRMYARGSNQYTEFRLCYAGERMAFHAPFDSKNFLRQKCPPERRGIGARCLY